MYLQHASGVKVSQKVSIPVFWGLDWFLRYCFREPQTNSIGFKSGDSGGEYHQLISFCSKKFSIKWLECLGSFSWYNLCTSGNTVWRNGIRDAPILLFSTYFSFRQFFFWPILLNILLKSFRFCLHFSKLKNTNDCFLRVFITGDCSIRVSRSL